jgi:hypothetical protein
LLVQPQSLRGNTEPPCSLGWAEKSGGRVHESPRCPDSRLYGGGPKGQVKRCFAICGRPIGAGHRNGRAGFAGRRFVTGQPLADAVEKGIGSTVDPPGPSSSPPEQVKKGHRSRRPANPSNERVFRQHRPEADPGRPGWDRSVAGVLLSFLASRFPCKRREGAKASRHVR